MGSRTASGKPLVAGDPHRPLDTPNVYYQNHVACPDFDALGLSFPGCPGFPHFGHNAHVAWCVTHAQADYHDLYVERFNNSGEYEWKGEWRKADGPSRDDQFSRGRRHRDRSRVDPPRAYHPRRPTRIRHCQQADLHRRAECLVRVPAAHAARRVRRRHGRGDARLGRSLQQLRICRRERRRGVPEQGPPAGQAGPQRVAAGAGLVGRVRVGRLRALRRSGAVEEPRHRLHSHGEQQDRARRLPPLHRPPLRARVQGPPHQGPRGGARRGDRGGHGRDTRRDHIHTSPDLLEASPGGGPRRRSLGPGPDGPH